MLVQSKWLLKKQSCPHLPAYIATRAESRCSSEIKWFTTLSSFFIIITIFLFLFSFSKFNCCLEEHGFLQPTRGGGGSARSFSTALNEGHLISHRAWRRNARLRITSLQLSVWRKRKNKNEQKKKKKKWRKKRKKGNWRPRPSWQDWWGQIGERNEVRNIIQTWRTKQCEIPNIIYSGIKVAELYKYSRPLHPGH